MAAVEAIGGADKLFDEVPVVVNVVGGVVVVVVEIVKGMVQSVGGGGVVVGEGLVVNF